MDKAVYSCLGGCAKTILTSLPEKDVLFIQGHERTMEAIDSRCAVCGFRDNGEPCTVCPKAHSGIDWDCCFMCGRKKEQHPNGICTNGFEPIWHCSKLLDSGSQYDGRPHPAAQGPEGPGRMVCLHQNGSGYECKRKAGHDGAHCSNMKRNGMVGPPTNIHWSAKLDRDSIGYARCKNCYSWQLDPHSEEWVSSVGGEKRRMCQGCKKWSLLD